MMGFLALSLVLLALGFVKAATGLQFLLALCNPIVAFIGGVIAWRRGYQPAAYQLIALTACG